MSSLSQAERSSGRPCPGDHDPTGCAACNRDCRVKPGNDMRGAHAETRHPRRDLCRPGREARHRDGALAGGAGECGADQDRRLRRLRHRSAHPERPLAEAAALAVHARPRDRRRHRREGRRARRGLHGQADRRRLEDHDPAADAVRALPLLRPLPRERQQVPDAGLLRALSRLRQAAAPVGRLGGVRLCRPRHAARHQDLQAAGRHAASARRARRAADLLHPRLQPGDPRRRLPMGRHRRHPGLRADRHSRRRGGAGDGRRPGDLRRRAGGAAPRSWRASSAPRRRSTSRR